jgi:hypothetical protein
MERFSASDRKRLVQLLGMLGSDFDGERANAGRLAHRLLVEHDLRWDDVVVSAIAVPVNAAPRTERDVVGDCIVRDWLLDGWEKRFLQSLAEWAGAYTVKQRLKLDEIARRLNVAPSSV